jgi:hypothetical protein
MPWMNQTMAEKAGILSSGSWPASTCSFSLCILLDYLPAVSLLNPDHIPSFSLRFLKLPIWFSILLTSRPHVESSFASWTAPECISAKNVNNAADIKMVLQERLEKLQFIEQADLGAAVELMLKRSEGQFVYLKFAFEALGAVWDDQQKLGVAPCQWTLAQLEQNLPPDSGVESTYLHSLNQLWEALLAEKPELLQLLMWRVLPVLAVCHELLTIQELAWVVDADEDEVRTIMSCLSLLPLPPLSLSGFLAAKSYLVFTCCHRWTCSYACWATSFHCTTTTSPPTTRQSWTGCCPVMARPTDSRWMCRQATSCWQRRAVACWPRVFPSALSRRPLCSLL